MPIPPFNQIKAPALAFFADGKPHRVREVFEALAPTFQLTESELNELLPSGTQRRWHNRANWACYDLFRAGLLMQPKKGVYQITEEGKVVEKQKPATIDRKFLLQFEPFRKFMDDKKERRGQTGSKNTSPAGALNEEEATPEERIESAFRELRETVVAELLAKLADIDPFRFERIVVDLLLAMGYGGSRTEAGWVTKKTGDEGIDGIINEDRLGLNQVHIQAKRWKSGVGRREIQNFVGALAGQQANKGVFITTSDYSQEAIAYTKALAQKVILIDGRRLAELMIEHGIGVSEGRPYHIKKIDSDYFEEA